MRQKKFISEINLILRQTKLNGLNPGSVVLHMNQQVKGFSSLG